MKKEFRVTGYLKVGDIIHIGNPLLKEEYSYYPVLEIKENIAITKFRKFNIKIYHNKFVYEYGKRLNGIYNNSYTIVNIETDKEAVALGQKHL